MTYEQNVHEIFNRHRGMLKRASRHNVLTECLTIAAIALYIHCLATNSLISAFLTWVLLCCVASSTGLWSWLGEGLGSLFCRCHDK